jgi:thiazole synthase
MTDELVIGNKRFNSRFILGSGKFSLEMMEVVMENGGVEIATLAVRRTNAGGEENILDYIPKGLTLLPNTSGARNADEAVRIAMLARDLGCGDMIKIEIIRDARYLLPDNCETIKATKMLSEEGFIVMPYMMPDLTAARSMADAGAAAIMPLGAPIGSNRGLLTKDFIKIMIDELDLPIIIDAGIGRPSQACEAMEMGCAAVMANTAVATAGNITMMAGAFKLAIEAGRMAFLSKPGRILQNRGEASSPMTEYSEMWNDENKNRH